MREVAWILLKIIKKTPHGVNHEMFRNVDSIVLINVLRQLTLSDCSHICKRLKSQQLRQLRQFSKNVQKRTPQKGALCKYSHSFEERLLNCDALRAFFNPSLKSLAFRTAQKRSIATVRRVSSDFDFNK